MEIYHPTQPWASKIQRDRLHAAKITQYVDNIRTMAPTKDLLAWECSSKMAKGLYWLGVQDATHNRRNPSQEPGVWAGVTVSTNYGRVCKGITKERWAQLQDPIWWIAHQITLSDRKIQYKTLESWVGFLLYVAMTYKSVILYLKGLYLSLNLWRPHQDEKGWGILHSCCDKSISPEGKPPMRVTTVIRFKVNVKAFTELSSAVDPPRILVGACTKEACYVVRDASGSGFGSSIWKPKERKIHAKFGTWSHRVSSSSLSNFRKVANLVEAIKHEVVNEVVPRGSEVFVFTENFVAESTMYKCSSLSELLHNMGLELWILNKQGQSRWRVASPDNWFQMVFTNLVGAWSLEEENDLTHGKWESSVSGLQWSTGDDFPVLAPCDIDNCLINNKKMLNGNT
eukprot:jgi/Psemu1/38294/gm1.38294_g